jgi:hypothetical protein
MEMTRRRRRFLIVLLLTILGVLALPAIAQAAPSPCDLIPDPSARETCLKAQQVVAPLPTLVSDITGSSIVQPILQGIVRAEADAVAAVLTKMIDYLLSSTTPDMTQDWFIEQYVLVGGVAAFLALFAGFGRMGVATKDQDAKEFGSAIASVVVFFIAFPLIPPIVTFFVMIADGPATEMFMKRAGDDLLKTVKLLTTELAKQDFGDAVLLPIIALILGVLGGVVTWIMLFFREAALYIYTAAAIFGLAMWVGGRWSNGMFKRIILSLIGLILFKPIMAFVLVIGVGLMGSGETEPALMGATLCLLVPLISWGAYKRIANHDIDEKKYIAGALVITRLFKK